MQPTKLLYMENNELHGNANIIEIKSLENGRYNIILDQTLFYPQGGGQPYDTGTIQQNEKIFLVEEVRFLDGIVNHIGKFETEVFNNKDNVSFSINEERRLYNSRNHSTGHLIDNAIEEIVPNLTPGKGYHFPDSPYVEYVETQDDETLQRIRENLERIVNELIEKNAPIKTKIITLEKLKKIAKHVPEYLPKDKPVRIVQIDGFEPGPCGGTHIQSTGAIKHIAITKAKNKKGSLRISYKIS